MRGWSAPFFDQINTKVDTKRTAMQEEPEERLDLIWGCVPIASFIERTPRQTLYMLEKGFIPARKVGGKWCASKRTLRQALADAPSEARR
jgi:hypothetical protein